MTPFERFANSLGMRKDGKAPELEFPPAHWEVDDHDKKESHPDECTRLPGSDPTSPDAQRDDNVQTPPEPLTIAQRIQTMISSLPPLFGTSLHTPPASTSASTSTSTTTAPPVTSTSTDTTQNNEQPVPPAMVSDPQLVALLSSPTIMNGSADKTRPSVWSILDQLRARLPGHIADDHSQPSEGHKESAAEGAQPEIVDEDNSSVMLYAPLIPDDSSEVELAKSEILREPEESRGPGPSTEGGPSRLHFEHPSAKRVWVPSSTKLSIQVNWWGYRLYLPPPVLAVLDDKKIEGTKRAAMITTALKWALDHVPILMVPLQMRPALKMLKLLIPYLAYIGVFVAWSWATIKMLDKGNGVVLTATWLLSVALIPSTWEDNEFPEVIAQRKAAEAQAPAPSTSAGPNPAP
ncbi:unnamed protein product [Somion occarium]|uniref:Uncharacterized protein n=1 Tax=Somion occarium TaxID=3059160 RepID=A0ABP1CEU5_9APHY